MKIFESFLRFKMRFREAFEFFLRKLCSQFLKKDG